MVCTPKRRQESGKMWFNSLMELYFKNVSHLDFDTERHEGKTQ